MAYNFQEVDNLVEKVFNLLDDMDIDAEMDTEHLEELYSFIAHPKNNDRYTLLKFVNENIYQETKTEHHPLIQALHEVYVQEYGAFKSPIKIGLKQQIDSLFQNSKPKDEFIRLMLHEYRKMGINSFLLTSDEFKTIQSESIVGSFFKLTPIVKPKLLPAISHLLSQMRDVLDENPELTRLQFILRQQDHYTVIDIDMNFKQAFIMDAAGDERQFNYHHLLDVIPEIERIVYVKNHNYQAKDKIKVSNLQKDEYSCSIFALDHVLAAATFPDLHGYLQSRMQVESEQIGFISWFDAPAPLVRNAQSPTFKEKYCETHSEARNYLAEYNIEVTVNKLKQLGIDLLSQMDDSTIEELASPEVSPRFQT